MQILQKGFAMLKDSKIYIAGHGGTLGKTLYNTLIDEGFNNIIIKTRKELDLVDQKSRGGFFCKRKTTICFFMRC